jgi:molybdate transport system permease protein
MYSMPFAVQPLQRAFEALARARWKPPPRWAPARWTVFTVALPLARPGFITAAVLSFAHTWASSAWC